jgi:hypothetical protein
MTKPKSNRLIRVLLCAVLGAMVVITTTSMSARAASDVDDDGEEVAPDIKFLRNILAGLGLERDGTNIDYRERSPLVVPPSRALPLPEPDNIAAKNPAWPKDPDVRRAQRLKAARKKPTKTVEEESYPELPNKLNAPGPAINTATQRPTGDNHDPTRPSTAAELQSKSIFNFDTLLGRHKDEYTTFVTEPPRASLIEPPPGYRTPSSAQPYGVGKEKWLPNAINPMDSPAIRGTD